MTSTVRCTSVDPTKEAHTSLSWLRLFCCCSSSSAGNGKGTRLERLTKNPKKLQDVFKQRQQEFISNLDNLFDIAHADVLQFMKIEEDRMFLQHQREPGRPGHLGGVDRKQTDKEERVRLRIVKENRRIKKLLGIIRTIARRFLFEF
ncbi:hypothetical protein AVEN_203370-1 [Araneus ventricosus]|uniref:Uncharacterized protein n=1 Tax=Araneus ventricosus TaxID=182803 RepID=A0A4Y2WB40_ARAVE|nr:hypothetical protein AVEN_203370-1 [Araneus ventricosus]